ncbi:hypothetical protein EVAR_12566_1 [Eumeta japonica]|uniref:Uncharacterized protein n=1 Tax=Eumeta variegata TaxID=151549 RepID=A0A4C1UFZ8_EUMVA|nr:hypothetical protein EVAR_12566_1 [Eumeta japonica]
MISIVKYKEDQLEHHVLENLVFEAPSSMMYRAVFVNSRNYELGSRHVGERSLYIRRAKFAFEADIPYINIMAAYSALVNAAIQQFNRNHRTIPKEEISKKQII